MVHFKIPNFLHHITVTVIEGENLEYLFTRYLQNFFNFAFRVFISPFRFVKVDNNEFISKGYLIHKILVGILHFALLLQFGTILKFEFHPSALKKNPSLSFDYFRMNCIMIYSVLLEILLWRGREKVRRSLALTPPIPGEFLKDPKKQRWSRWKRKAMVHGYILVGLANLAVTILLCWVQTPHRKSFQGFKKKDGTLTETGFVFAIVNMILTVFSALFVLIANWLVLISIFAVKEIVDHTKKAVTLSAESLMKDIQELLRMRKQIQTINKFAGPILVVMFVDIIGHTATSIGRPQEDYYGIQLLDFLRQVGNVGCLFYAAEAEYQATLLTRSILFKAAKSNSHLSGNTDKKKWVESRCDVEALKILLHSAPGSNGLAGWKFFCISYSFLGTAVSITLTYALVMLQFVATPNTDPMDGKA